MAFKIQIHAIGKEKSQEMLALSNEYIKRLPWKIETTEVATKGLIKDQEADKLLKNVGAGFLKIALDENGSSYYSVKFANLLENTMHEGQNAAFLIGGANGHGKEVLKQADVVLSLSKLTFAHKLVRIILLEQLYRAYTIISGHPYHK